MQKENLWKLFERTGSPQVYLQYKTEMSKEIMPGGMQDRQKALKQVKNDGEKCKGARA